MMWEKSAVEMAEFVRTGQISSRELTELLLDRIEKVNPSINAIVQYDSEAALAQAREADEWLAREGPRGPLHGVPVTVKDTFDVAGLISAAGTLGRAGHAPQSDATAVQRLKAAGAIVLGKTNMPEFALAVETDNRVYGRTNNPYALDRTPGGSSGGPAAAVAAGMVPLELGSDGGGSIRLPAHNCGVAGLKPTTGRISHAGHFPQPYGGSAQLFACGPLARRVGDLRTALSLLEGEDWQDPSTGPLPSTPPERALGSLRVAYYADDGVRPSCAETQATVMRAAKVLADAGCRVVDARPPDLADAQEIHLALIIHDRHMIREWMSEANTAAEQVHPWVQAGLAYLDSAAEDCAPEFGTMILYELRCFQRKALGFMRDYDVLLSPTAAFPALPHGQGVQGDNYSGYAYATLHNVTGWPAAAVRAGSTAGGLPIAVQIAARPFREDLVLLVAEHLEQALGGWRPPPGL